MQFTEKMVREDYRKLTLLLIERGLTITTMESATSGQIASLVTDTEGASAVMKGAYITYSNEAKIQAGVSAETIAVHSVYSRETAREMAMVCSKAFGADIGIGVTGTMGNVDPANAEASVPGQVYYAICYKGQVMDYYEELEPQASRLLYKLAVAKAVSDRLFALLQNKF